LEAWSRASEYCLEKYFTAEHAEIAERTSCAKEISARLVSFAVDSKLFIVSGAPWRHAELLHMNGGLFVLRFHENCE
jgi:hypothetical protein